MFGVVQNDAHQISGTGNDNVEHARFNAFQTFFETLTIVGDTVIGIDQKYDAIPSAEF